MHRGVGGKTRDRQLVLENGAKLGDCRTVEVGVSEYNSDNALCGHKGIMNILKLTLNKY